MEKINQYKEFCKKNNLKEGHYKSLKAFYEYLEKNKEE